MYRAATSTSTGAAANPTAPSVGAFPPAKTCPSGHYPDASRAHPKAPAPQWEATTHPTLTLRRRRSPAVRSAPESAVIATSPMAAAYPAWRLAQSSSATGFQHRAAQEHLWVRARTSSGLSMSVEWAPLASTIPASAPSLSRSGQGR